MRAAPALLYLAAAPLAAAVIPFREHFAQLHHAVTRPLHLPDLKTLITRPARARDADPAKAPAPPPPRPQQHQSPPGPDERLDGPPPVEPKRSLGFSRHTSLSSGAHAHDDFAAKGEAPSPAVFLHRYMQSGPAARDARMRERGFRAAAGHHTAALDALARANPALARPLRDMKVRLQRAQDRVKEPPARGRQAGGRAWRGSERAASGRASPASERATTGRGTPASERPASRSRSTGPEHAASERGAPRAASEKRGEPGRASSGGRAPSVGGNEHPPLLEDIGRRMARGGGRRTWSSSSTGESLMPEP